jgi:hypothetical protein
MRPAWVGEANKEVSQQPWGKPGAVHAATLALLAEAGKHEIKGAHRKGDAREFGSRDLPEQ